MGSLRVGLVAFVLIAIPVAQAQGGGPLVAWPDALALADGRVVASRAEFEGKRRGEIVSLFEENVYGRTPKHSVPVKVVSDTVAHGVLGGLATRRQMTLAVGIRGERTWHLLVYTPAAAKRPVPVIVGLNFDGNQTVNSDKGVELNPVWVKDPALERVPLALEQVGHVQRNAQAETRGAAATQWQLRMLLARGYGLATMDAGEIEPDFNGGIGYGVRPLLFGPKQRLPEADDWGAIGAWAWGMGRMLDVLAAVPEADSKRLVAFGFSRFGKTALWAAAQDSRFAAVLSNESGQAGATLSHRKRGEPVDHLMAAFPYWFCENYQHFLGRVETLPVDGHLLLALIAPRPLYVGSAASDPFSDPEGEFLAVRAVGPVYGLYGEKGVGVEFMPGLNHSVGTRVAYHVRPGGHDVTAYDWDQYLRFLDRVLTAD